jgi:translation initiation factor IF-1
MSSYIQIGDKGFKRIHSARVVSSRKRLTDTAVIKLANVPTLLSDDRKRIKVGDVVTVTFGYNGNNNIEFNGYVSEIKPTSPIEILCEDEMWQLKQQTVTKAWESVKLVDVLKFLVSDADTVECPDVTITNFRLVKATKAKALEELKEAYGIDIYFRDKKLFAGLAYTEGGETVNYHFQKNVPSRLLQKGLTYKRKEDVKIKVEAISMLPDNKQLKETVGDPDGETHTLHFYNLTSSELKKQAEAKIDLMKYDGYRGKLRVFGLPFTKHGDVAKLKCDVNPDKNGSFFIDEVETDYSNSGIVKMVSLGKRAA